MLEGYLEGTLDSTGEFTLDLRAEAQKMSSFQQQEPALWLLKGVQAAVASQSSEVSIRLGRKRIELSFQPGPEVGPCDLQGEELWCRHLRMALTLALASGPRNLKLSEGARVIFGEPLMKEHSGVRLQLERRARPWWQWSDPELASISLTLARRCAFCPILVRVDRRLQLNPAPELSPLFGTSLPKIGWNEGVEATPWLSESWKLADGKPAFSLHPPARRVSAEIRVGETGWPGRNLEGLIEGKAASCLARVQSPLHIHSLRAKEDGKLARVVMLTETVMAGALMQISDPNLLCLRFRLTRLTKTSTRVEEVLLAPLPADQVVANSGNLARLDFPLIRCQHWLGLCSSGQARGGLFLVEDGVVLNPVTGWARFPGTTALVATHGRATDLGQLNPVLDTALENLVDWARREENEEFQRVRAWLFSPQTCERLRVPLSTREHWRKLSSAR